MHIDNLYKNTDILLFKECFALEKIHGTSSRVSWKNNKINLFSGGENYKEFKEIFNLEELEKKFKELFDCDVVVYGESYGGTCQGMKDTYGANLKFIVFDVTVDKHWLNVPNAQDVAIKLGLEFVSYKKVRTTINTLNKERDRDSEQAVRNGCGKGKLREGIILRPLIEVIKNNDKRIISKHKRDEFLETKTKREVDPARLQLIEDAKAIAEEWVIPMRLNHVLDKLGNPDSIKETGNVIKSMIKDIEREAKGEIVKSKLSRKEIGSKTAMLYKKKISRI